MVMIEVSVRQIMGSSSLLLLESLESALRGGQSRAVDGGSLMRKSVDSSGVSYKEW